MSVWHDVGYYCIILLANMQGLSAEVYESAAVDGANNIQTFFPDNHSYDGIQHFLLYHTGNYQLF